MSDSKKRFMAILHRVEEQELTCRTCDFTGKIKTLTCIIPKPPQYPYWICHTCEALHMNSVPIHTDFLGAFSGLMSESILARWAING